ncbi:MAG: MBL fold metallo-hydrolase, partial [Caldisphaera sp.]|nr:MBL fold metallo-hydrolase [Caldisphaera sp.]
MNSSMLSSRRVVKLGSVEQCKLVVVVDNNMDSELETAWGLSIFIETPSSNFLFDTGPDKGVLERNMRKLKININDIDFVVISHDHGDHTGGLGYLAKNRPDITVYVPIGTSWIARSYGIKVVEVDKTIKLSEGVAIIGWLNGPPSEQSLAINVKGLGLFVFGGCSHPGIVSIVEK